MAVKLNDVLKSSPGMSVQRPGSKIIFANKFGYTPKPDDEKAFVTRHPVQKHLSRVGNGDDVFQATNISTFERMKNRFGYDNSDDEKTEFAADKGKQKQEIGVTEEELIEMWEEAEQICETSMETATRMAQELADKYYHPHFVHSFVKDWKNPDKRSYGVVAQRHLFDDPERHYRYDRIEKAVHPSPPPKFKTLSSKKAVRVSKEEAEINEYGAYGGSPRAISKGDVSISSKGNAKGPVSTTTANDNKKKPKLKLVVNNENLGYPNGRAGEATPGQTKKKRFTWLKKVMETKIDETLDPSDAASTYIHDFVHSDNARFAGKSRKERIRMALGAYYHNHRKANTKK